MGVCLTSQNVWSFAIQGGPKDQTPIFVFWKLSRTSLASANYILELLHNCGSQIVEHKAMLLGYDPVYKVFKVA